MLNKFYRLTSPQCNNRDYTNAADAFDYAVDFSAESTFFSLWGVKNRNYKSPMTKYF